MLKTKNNLMNVERLQKIMDDHALDALVATTLGNVFYFTGVLCDGLKLFPYDHQTYAIITRDNPLAPYYITSQGMVNQALDAFEGLAGAESYGRFYRAEPFSEMTLNTDEEWLFEKSVKQPAQPDPVTALITVFQKFGLSGKKIGLDEVNLSNGYYQEISERFKSGTFIQASKLLRHIRKVKTPTEVSRLRDVSKINETAIQDLLDQVKEGVTELELARVFAQSVVRQGANPSFICVRFGRNGVMAERRATNTKLVPGEAIFIDVGCEYRGYYADFGRTACLGEPNLRLKETYEMVKHSHLAAIERTKPGMTGGDVFDLTLQDAKKMGLTDYQRHHTGHGIGVELYEHVMITPGNPDVIEEGTVINHESPYYEFGLGGIIVEDPFVVKAEGNQVLTTISPELLRA